MKFITLKKQYHNKENKQNHITITYVDFLETPGHLICN